MSDQPNILTLGGASWTLPPFPFGVIRRLQPRALRIANELATGGVETLAARLDEKALEDMLGLVADAIAAVEPGVTRDTLDAMTFTTADLVGAQTPILRACGLVRAPSQGEGGDAPKA